MHFAENERYRHVALAQHTWHSPGHRLLSEKAASKATVQSGLHCTHLSQLCQQCLQHYGCTRTVPRLCTTTHLHHKPAHIIRIGIASAPDRKAHQLKGCPNHHQQHVPGSVPYCLHQVCNCCEAKGDGCYDGEHQRGNIACTPAFGYVFLH